MVNKNTFSSKAFMAGAALDFGSSLFNNFLQSNNIRQQQRWAEKMWHMNNEYNLPVNQKKRLDAAGINGALALSGAQTSSGSSSPTTPTTSNIVPMSFDTTKQLLAQEQQIRAQSELYDQEVESKRLENDAQRIENLYKEEGILKDLGYKDQMVRQLLLDNNFNASTLQKRIKQVYEQTEQSIIQTGIMRIEHNMADTRYKNLPEQIKAEFNLMYAQTAAQYASAYLANEQAKHEGYKTELTQKMILKTAADTLKTNAEAYGIKLSNYQAFQTMQYEINKARNNQGADNLYQMLQNGSAEDIMLQVALSALPLGGALKGLKWLKNSRHLKRLIQTGENTFKWY